MIQDIAKATTGGRQRKSRAGYKHKKKRAYTVRIKRHHPLNSIWRQMMGRCCLPSNRGFKYYGGRGISVCSQWFDFWKFVEDMGPRPSGTSIDRIDNNGNYSPENCRWADRTTQSRNTSRNIYFEFNGVRKTMAEWCREFGLKDTTVRYRLLRGLSVERAFSIRPLVRGRRLEGAVAECFKI